MEIGPKDVRGTPLASPIASHLGEIGHREFKRRGQYAAYHECRIVDARLPPAG